MASVTITPATWSNDTSVGTEPWATPSNAATSNDVRTTCGNDAAEVGQYLKGVDTTSGSIPAGSTIDGIEVIAEISASGSGDTQDNSIRLVIGGTITGDNKAVAGNWPGTDTIKTWGGPTDLWGLGSLTIAQVISSTAGFVISCKETEGKSDPDTGAIDHAYIIIYYTPPAGGSVMQTRSLLGVGN